MGNELKYATFSYRRKNICDRMCALTGTFPNGYQSFFMGKNVFETSQNGLARPMYVENNPPQSANNALTTFVQKSQLVFHTRIRTLHFNYNNCF